jgi:hypothetical protein
MSLARFESISSCISLLFEILSSSRVVERPFELRRVSRPLVFAAVLLGDYWQSQVSFEVCEPRRKPVKALVSRRLSRDEKLSVSRF